MMNKNTKIIRDYQNRHHRSQRYLKSNHPLKGLRVLKGYTQEEMAKKAKISIRAYQTYEQKIRIPNVEVAIRIAKILNTTCETIWG
jgi:Predicted transcriptional regulators